MSPKPKYELRIDLNVLNHLGINLYSNVPAVLSEVVANSWDADSERVEIVIDDRKGVISIEDNGTGMDERDINEKYLMVGYQRRIEEGVITPIHKRHVMGRKGIGKLSLFSIADTIEIQSAKKSGRGAPEKNGFIMNAVKIRKAIEDGGGTYNPAPFDQKKIGVSKGTKIVLRDLRKSVATAEAFLRTRLARRFSVLG